MSPNSLVVLGGIPARKHHFWQDDEEQMATKVSVSMRMKSHHKLYEPNEKG